MPATKSNILLSTLNKSAIAGIIILLLFPLLVYLGGGDIQRKICTQTCKKRIFLLVIKEQASVLQ